MALRKVFYLSSVLLSLFSMVYMDTLCAKSKDKTMLTVRKANERGLSQHPWLISHHTFSFANYLDRKHMGFRNLRVINEDTIAGGKGFDSHPHDNMEIITYVIEGSLRHKDSMGNTEVIRPNEIQRMSAGSGIIHSEYNDSNDKKTHLYQIWILPKNKGIKPSYAQKSFAEELKKNKLTLVASNQGREGSISINQDVDIYLSRLHKNDTLEFTPMKDRHLWIQIIKGKVNINGTEVAGGDGISLVSNPLRFNALEESEFMLFDLS